MKFNDIHVSSNVEPINKMIGKLKEIKSNYDGSNRDNIVASIRSTVLEDFKKISTLDHIDNRIRRKQDSKILDENTINVFNDMQTIERAYNSIDRSQYKRFIKESEDNIEDLVNDNSIDTMVDKMLNVLKGVSGKVEEYKDYVDADVDSVPMLEKKLNDYSNTNLLLEFENPDAESDYFMKLELISFDDFKSFIPAYSYFVNICCRANSVSEAKKIFKTNVDKSLKYINKKIDGTVQPRNDMWIEQVNVYREYDSFVTQTKPSSSEYISKGTWYQSRGSKRPEISLFKYVRLDKTMVSRYMDGE